MTLLPDDDEITVVADCKLVDAETLGLCSPSGRAPRGPTLPRHYRGRSFDYVLPINLGEGEERLSNETWRLLVVWSDRLAARFESSQGGKLEREAESLAKAHKKQLSRGLANEADAQKAATRVVERLKLHRAEVSVRSKERTLERSRPGRPKEGEAAPKELVWLVDIDLQTRHRCHRDAPTSGLLLSPHH